MEKVKISYKLVLSNGITEIDELKFEKHNETPHVSGNQTSANPRTFEGVIPVVWVFDKLEVGVRCFGTQAEAGWTLEVKVNDKDLTKKPIKKVLKPNGIKTYYHSHPIP